MKYCYWVWKELHLNGKIPRENWTELLVVFFWHKVLYGRRSVYRFNYPSYIRYATLCPSVIYSLHDISIVHVVILVRCIQISSEASYSKYYFIIDRIQKRAFSNQVEIKVNHTHWEAKSDLMSSPNVCSHLRTRNGKEWTLHWFPLELMKPVVVSSNVGVFSG